MRQLQQKAPRVAGLKLGAAKQAGSGGPLPHELQLMGGACGTGAAMAISIAVGCALIWWMIGSLIVKGLTICGCLHQQLPCRMACLDCPRGCKHQNRAGAYALRAPGWYAFPARHLGKARLLAVGMRWRLRYWRHAAQISSCAAAKPHADLLSCGAGGSAATERRREEKNTVAKLTALVAILTQKVDILLQASHLATIGTIAQPAAAETPVRGRSRLRRGLNRWSEVVDDDDPPASVRPPSLWDRLQSMLHHAALEGPPAEGQLRAALQQLVAENRPGAAPLLAAKHGDTRTAPVVKDPLRSKQHILPGPPRSYAEAAARVPSARLHPGQWEARVLTLPQFFNDPLLEPAVVSCASAEEVVKAQQWHAARGSTTGMMLVDLSDAGSGGRVMIQGAAGPQL